MKLTTEQMRQVAEWAHRTYTCTECNAAPGEQCKDRSTGYVHGQRFKLAVIPYIESAKKEQAKNPCRDLSIPFDPHWICEHESRRCNGHDVSGIPPWTASEPAR